MRRRRFLKSAGLLSMPLVWLPAPVSEEKAAEYEAPSAFGPESSSWELSNAGQKLVVTASEHEVSYQSFVRNPKGDWKEGSLPSNQFISGPSFKFSGAYVPQSLTSRRLELHGSGQGMAQDISPLKYSWTAEVTHHESSPWFRIVVSLQIPRDMKLDQGSTLEPQIILWLNSTSTMMEGQATSWRRILLEQPTRNSLHASGNDLPAVYLQDANRGVETMIFFEMADMSWMSMHNIPRFLGYHCTTVSVLEPDGNQRLGIGLVARRAGGSLLPAGEARFTYYLLQRHFEGLITEQEAVTRWMEALLPLFAEKLTWPKCATSWQEFAAGTVRDIQKKDVALIDVNGHRGLRAYVKATSELWHEQGKNFELMTMADVLWPSLLYLKIHPDEAYQQVVNELLASLPHFYHEDTRSISNDFVRGKDEVADSWYPFENSLVKYPMIGALPGSATLTQNFLSAYETSGKLARRYNYLFPIYYRTDNFEQRGAGTNYAIGGLYAWGGIIAHRLTQDSKFLDEARRAVEVLTTVRAASLFHEPQELAYGALAAAELDMPDAARYLIYEQLRMFYWYSDPSQKTHDIRGMAQAAASILYPAFKENVEAILPWTGVMKRGVMIEALLSFMDQQRRNNFYFFPACHGNASAASPLPYIPYENLGTLELGGRTGVVGQEIYGAGEVLWVYLMFEALGNTSNREFMLVNLDLVDALDSAKFPPSELNFILFNPTDSNGSTEIAIPVAHGAPVRFTAGGEALNHSVHLEARKYIRIKAEY